MFNIYVHQYMYMLCSVCIRICVDHSFVNFAYLLVFSLCLDSKSEICVLVNQPLISFSQPPISLTATHLAISNPSLKRATQFLEFIQPSCLQQPPIAKTQPPFFTAQPPISPTQLYPCQPFFYLTFPSSFKFNHIYLLKIANRLF